MEDGYPVNDIDDWAQHIANTSELGGQGLLVGGDTEMSGGPSDSVMTGASPLVAATDDRLVCYGMVSPDLGSLISH